MTYYQTKLTGYVSGLFLRGFDANDRPLMRAVLSYNHVPGKPWRKYAIDLKTWDDAQTASDAMMKRSMVELQCVCDDANIADETAVSNVQSYEYFKRLPISDFWGCIDEKDVA